MQKIKINSIYLLFIIFFCHSLIAKNTPTSNLNLKSKFPYALITEDYGILNSEDLEINGCIAHPSPFSENSISYPYWRCLRTSLVTFNCNNRNADGTYSNDETLMSIEVKPPEEKGIYVARRAVELKRCLWFKKRWNHLTKKQQFVCLSGAQFGLHAEDDGSMVRTWSFDKFKTKKGCESYFEGYCDLKYLKKHKMCGN